MFHFYSPGIGGVLKMRYIYMEIYMLISNNKFQRIYVRDSVLSVHAPVVVYLYFFLAEYKTFPFRIIYKTVYTD